MIKTIFLDMDGVIADLEGGLKRMFDITDEDLKDKKRVFGHWLPEYTKIGGFRFENPMTNGYYLVSHLLKSKIDICILTSAGKFYKPISDVVSQKKKFLERNYPELTSIPFCATTSGADKAKFANGDSLLIDDHLGNITKFRDNGGHAIHYHKDILFEDFVSEFNSYTMKSEVQ